MEKIIQAIENKHGGKVVQCTDLRDLSDGEVDALVKAIIDAKPVTLEELNARLAQR